MVIRWSVVVIVLVVLFARVDAANAGAFVVRSCAHGQTADGSSWSYTSNMAAQFVTGTSCAAGLSIAERFHPPDSVGGAYGFWRLDAPPTTSIRKLSITSYLNTFADDQWRALILADGTVIESCQVPSGAAERCTKGGATSNSGYEVRASSISLGVRCEAPPETGCIHGAPPYHSVEARLYGSTVTIEDPVAPKLSVPTGGLVAGGWLRGTVGVSASASDATGVKSFRVFDEGRAVLARVDRRCDFGKTVPCAPGGRVTPSGEMAVDTGKLGDGVHTVRVRAVDAADNVVDSAPVQVSVDNTPPAAVGNVRNGRGGVWASRRTQRIVWDLPAGEVSPVVGAAVAACDSGQRCVAVPAVTPGSAEVQLPRQGRFEGAVTLTDEAGNVGAAAPFAVGFDRSKPRRPRLVGRTVKGKRRARRVRVKLRRDAGPAPLERVAARVCRRGAKRCRPVPDANPKRVRLKLKRDGRRVLRVRVVDAAGNRSRETVRRLR